MSTRVVLRPFLVLLLSAVAGLAPSRPAAATVERPICVGAAGHTLVCAP